MVLTSKGDVLWTLDEKFDDVIKVDFTSHTEVRRAVNVGRCASLCTSASWCSSFFFLPTIKKCLLNEFVFAKPGGGQSSPGARYFRADSGKVEQVSVYWLEIRHVISWGNVKHRCQCHGYTKTKLLSLLFCSLYLASHESFFDGIIIINKKK